jgi:hypothetical protein
MTLKEKRIFFNWLQKHEALQYYKKNRYLFLTASSRNLGFLSYIDMSITNAICSAFTWVFTEQGENYWRNLDFLWRNSEEYNNCFPI